MSDNESTAGEPLPIGTEKGVASTEGVSAEEVKSFVERIENVMQEQKEKREDLKEIYAELKGRGFDVKAIRTIIRLRAKDHATRQEEEAILELYMQALGMV